MGNDNLNHSFLIRNAYCYVLALVFQSLYVIWSFRLETQRIFSSFPLYSGVLLECGLFFIFRYRACSFNMYFSNLEYFRKVFFFWIIIFSLNSGPCFGSPLYGFFYLHIDYIQYSTFSLNFFISDKMIFDFFIFFSLFYILLNLLRHWHFFLMLYLFIQSSWCLLQLFSFTKWFKCFCFYV